MFIKGLSSQAGEFLSFLFNPWRPNAFHFRVLRVSSVVPFSFELGRVSFADQDFQQFELGLHVFVFVILHRQRGPVLLLHIPTGRHWQETAVI